MSIIYLFVFHLIIQLAQWNKITGRNFSGGSPGNNC